MPKLEVLEIWNATYTYGGEVLANDQRVGATCVFRYVYSSKKPKITFASNWFGTRKTVPLMLGSDMEYCWTNLPRHGPGNPLTIAVEDLPGRPSCHEDAITTLQLRGDILHPLSRYQLRFEYEQLHRKKLEPNTQPAETQNEEEGGG